MLNVDVTIERISNGFIVTGKDSTKTKTYYSSLEKFLTAEIIEEVKEIDEYFKRHEADGVEFGLTATTTQHIKAK